MYINYYLTRGMDFLQNGLLVGHKVRDGHLVDLIRCEGTDEEGVYRYKLSTVDILDDPDGVAIDMTGRRSIMDISDTVITAAVRLADTRGWSRYGESYNMTAEEVREAIRKEDPVLAIMLFAK